MKKLCLIKNPALFQGEKYLNGKRNYFEGWYFKNIGNDGSISFIPGINVTASETKAFIQVITKERSYFVNYEATDFYFSHAPFFIKIKDNYFSPEKISVKIKDEAQSLDICGEIEYSNSRNIKATRASPNIMGPFSFLPFMECNHAVISMKNTLHGRVNVNESMLDFDGGTGYIEKDWGCSFPKTYLWCQGNAFNDSDVAFMFSAADIPFKPFSFQGLICVLMIGAIEYKFTTYNGARIEKWNVTENTADITVKRGKYRLNFKAKAEGEHCLIAPVRGEMSKEILETVSAKLTVTLTKGGEEVFCDTSQGCGLEMV